MQASRMPVNQIEQGKQVDPNDVYEVPVQAAHFYGRVVFGSEATFPRGRQQPGKNADPDDHVQRVQPGHHEIKREKNLGVSGVGVLAGMPGDVHLTELETGSGDMVLLELFVVLDSLDAKEDESKNDGKNQVAQQHGTLGVLGRVDRQNHGQAAADQDSRVGSTQAESQGLAGGAKFGEVLEAVDQIGAEQSTEEHDFGGEENP